MSATTTLETSPASISTARRRIFDSVFPPPAATSLETPPSPPPAPAHGYNTRHHPQSSSPARDDRPSSVSLLPNPATVHARESRAWHIATTFLAFLDMAFPDTPREWIELRGPPGRDVVEAVRYLVLNNDDGSVEGRENLMEWYVCEVRRHFLGWVRPRCQIPEKVEDPSSKLEEILGVLTTAQNIYLYQLRSYLLISQADSSPRKTPRRATKKLGNVVEPSSNDPRIRTFLRSLNSIISYSLPDPAWSELVYSVFLELCGLAVGLAGGAEKEAEDDDTNTVTSGEVSSVPDDSLYDAVPESFTTVTDLDGDIVVAMDEGDIIVPEKMDGMDDFEDFKRQPKGLKADARRKVLKLWEAMEKLGIGGGGRRGERVFAEVINTLITMYINQSFAQQWESPSLAGQKLNEWIENVLGRLIIDVLFSSTVRDQGGDARLDKLSPRESLRVSRESLNKRRHGGMDLDFGAGAGEEEQKRRKEDLDSWKKIAVGRLGRLRVSELFDIVVEWPTSIGGVEDLKAYITTPQTRLHLTTTFSAALNARILHPAAATADVLGAYIRLIRAFTVLDSRGVLLDRVSRNIRRYLREREDTVRVIVRGIMSESIIPTADEAELSELSIELVKGVPTMQAMSNGVEDLDYEDMNWVPDPVDAGPEFRRNKGLDVVGSLITLWENKDVWIQEIQTVLSARLLVEPIYDFENEIRTVELLKMRFGEAPTQSCDVMLKDMIDSKRVDSVILEVQKRKLDRIGCEFHAKILSRLYWPELKQETWVIPPPIVKLMDVYQKGFEKLKKKRKLDWLYPFGTVEVEMELADRVVTVPDATPPQAAVIYAFATPGVDVEDEPKSMTVEQLHEEIGMPHALLRSSITFWVEQGILVEDSPGVFTVLEKTSSRATAPLVQHMLDDGNTQELDQVDEGKLKEQNVVEQFVVGMLTNGGAMHTDRIAMMLGMLVPGGFRWSMEELSEFLNGLKEKRKVEVTGHGWKIV